MNRPNAIKHMTIGGLLAGASFGALYPVIVLIVSVLNPNTPTNGNEMFMPQTPEQWLQIIGFVVVLGVIIGSVIGLVLGFLTGYVMDWRVRRLHFPLDSDAIKQTQVHIHWIVFTIVGIGGLITFYTVISMTYFVAGVTMVVIPALIGLLVALWGASRYANQLVIWNARQSH
ncbi:MAG: hypothetical protein AAF846_17960 [Chloroflexota bacterium]